MKIAVVAAVWTLVLLPASAGTLSIRSAVLSPMVYFHFCLGLNDSV
jgi:hypothetical protein